MPITKEEITKRSEGLRLARADSRIEGMRSSPEGAAVLDAWARGECDDDEARCRLLANLEEVKKRLAADRA